MNSKILSLVFITSFLLVSCTEKEKVVEQPQVVPIEQATEQSRIIPSEEEKVEPRIGVVTTTKNREVVLPNVKEGETITSPFMITGKVPTNWVHEGQFPIRLLTKNDTEIARTIGTGSLYDSEGRMYYPEINFNSKLEFTVPPGEQTGKLVFMADNPSGEPENDEWVVVNVKFK